MSEASLKTGQTGKYIVLVTDWNEPGNHWIKGFSTLEVARKAVSEKVAEHEEIMNRIVIIRGEIIQIGNGDY
jgi:hypothetical protein